MAAIRNLCVARGYFPSGAQEVAYTVPDGNTFLFKAAAMTPSFSGAWNATIFLVAPSVPVTVVLATSQLMSGGSWRWEGWTALNGGDEIQMYSDAVQFSYWIAGALLPFAP